MSEQTSKEIRSTVTSDGDIQISIVSVPMPTPSENEVLIKVEAAPINQGASSTHESHDPKIGSSHAGR